MEKITFNMKGYETFYGKTEQRDIIASTDRIFAVTDELKSIIDDYNFDVVTVYENDSAEYEWYNDETSDITIKDKLLMAFLLYYYNFTKSSERDNKQFKFEIVVMNECGSASLIIE